jgi:DNA-binding transcriptional LysR family regulator
MELRQLKAFVAVAEERNFTRAAARLYVAQSGLSATVRSLERELHAPLFVRSTRRVALTPAGSALLPEARRTLASARAAEDAVVAIEGLRHGTLNLGVVQAASLFDLAGLLARYHAAYPGIQLNLRHASSADLVQFVHDGTLDLTFATATDERDDDLLTMPLVRSPLVALCRRDDEWRGRDSVALATVAEREQVGFPVGWGVRTLVDRAMRSAGLEPSTNLEVNDSDTLLDIVEAGLGVAIVPEGIVRVRPNLRTITISTGSWYWIIGAHVIAPGPVNPAARALWTMLRPDEIPA